MNYEQLKNSILQEAICGRLVPQDPADEPASLLLDKIEREKAALAKAKKTKPDKNASRIHRTADGHWMERFTDKHRPEVCIDEEIPFDIPETWEWCRLGFIFDHNTGKALNGGKGPGTPLTYITTSNLYWDRFELDNLKSMNFKDSEIDKCTIRKGDLLVCEGGDFGRSAIWNYDFDMRIQNHIHRLRSYVQVETKFYYYILMLYKGIGIIAGKGIGIQGLSSGALHNILLPLPPLPEQHRIVEKLEQVLPKVEEYGKAQERLDKLNGALPEKLKASVLQEAIEGRLVAQDPTDEPASLLLDKIEREKAALAKAKKIKPDKNASRIHRTPDGHWMERFADKRRHEVCIDDEIPFDIPDSWEWTRFGTIMINRDSERIPLSVAQRNNLEKIYDYYGASGVIDKVDKFLFGKDLLLIGEDGANLINRSTPIAFIARGKYWVNNHAHVLDTCCGLEKEYISIFINAISLVDYVTGTAQPKMNQEKMNSILVAVPPKEEQVRIIQRCNEILPKVEALA